MSLNQDVFLEGVDTPKDNTLQWTVMQVFESSLKLAKDQKERIIILGNFDGFHLGHQALLKEAIKGKKPGQVLTIFTFEPHPSQVLLPQGDHRRIWGPEERRNYLKSFPVDELIEQTFDLSLAQLAPSEFLQKYIIPLAPKVLITGEDFKFGKDRKGDSAFLKQTCTDLGIKYTALSIVTQDGEKVSTSRIKEAFMQGKFKDGLAWLGHDYFLLGTVTQGDRRGHQLGFPTANLQFPYKPSLKMGVYAVNCHYNEQKLYGVMNIGTTPTFKDDLLLKCEVHFLDFGGNLYDQTLKIFIRDFLRPEQKFSSKNALIEQIHSDIVRAKKVLKI